MAHHFRELERRQVFLLPADMLDWLPEGDIVHLIVDAVAMMDLGGFEAGYKLGRAGQAPFAPQVLLALLIHAYSHGVRSSRAIERLCGRDAGYRFIVGGTVPDHTVIARFRQRHAARMREVFLAMLRLCHEAGLVRLGLVALDGTKVAANAALDANRTASGIDEQVARMLAEAEAADAQEDGRSGAQRGGELPAALARRGDRLARLRQCQDKLRRQAAEAASLRAVFHLALRQTEGLVGSIIGLLGLSLAVPDHSTLSRRAATLEVPRPQARRDGEPLHLLVDSTGLKLCGAGEWLVEEHGAKTRRSWRTLHIGVDAGTGQIVAAALTRKEVDDGFQVGPLLDQVATSVASFTADGAYDQDSVSNTVAERHPEAAIIVPPRSTAVPSETAETAPTQRDHHLEFIAKHGRAAWQRASGYTVRARAEAAIGRFKQVIGDGLRSRTDERRATEVDVAVHALNRMLDLGRPNSVRIA